MINNLAAYRRRAKLTQKEFADKLGVATTTLSKWENPEFDLMEIKTNDLKDICELLNICFWDLVEIKKGEN